MKISVIIPTWNRASVLPRAIESVLAQTVLPDEVIVVDDGSSDGSAELVQKRFPGINLLKQPQKGVSAARNTGIRNTSGNWIALLDSDDEWLPEKLAMQISAIENSDSVFACHTDEIWIRNGKRVNPMNKHKKPDGRIFQQCLPLCCVSPSSVLLHRSVFDDVGMFDESYPACEDYELWLRVFSQYDALLVDQPLLIKYGGHSDQLSRAYWGMDRFRIRAIESVLEKNELQVEDRNLSIEILQEKCRILALGAKKRNKHDEVARYRALSAKYSITPC